MPKSSTFVGLLRVAVRPDSFVLCGYAAIEVRERAVPALKGVMVSDLTYARLDLDSSQTMILDYYLLDECKPRYIAKVLDLLSQDASGVRRAGANVMDLTIHYDSRTITLHNSIEDGSTPDYKLVRLAFSVFEDLLRSRLKDLLGKWLCRIYENSAGVLAWLVFNSATSVVV